MKLVFKEAESNIALSKIPIKIKDKNDLKFEKITNDSGFIFLNTTKDKLPLILNCNFLGYNQQFDTITDFGTYTLYLKLEYKYTKDIVITDQYLATRASQSVNKVKVIDAKTIKSMAANNLKDVLQNQLNVSMGQDQFLGSSINIGGLGGQNIKILIDGVPIIGRLGGNIDVSQINLNDVERIEIIEGPMSISYGTNALGGAINIITKKKLLKNIELLAQYYYETVGTHQSNMSLGLRKKNGIYHFNIGRNFFDGWNPIDEGRYMIWKPKEQYFGKIQYVRKIKSIDLILKSDFFIDELKNRGLPRSPYFETAFDEYYKTKRIDNSISLNGKVKKNNFLNGMLAYNVYSRTKGRYLRDLVNLKDYLVNNINEQDTIFFNNLMSRSTITRAEVLHRFSYQLGYDINIETGKGIRLGSTKKHISDIALFSGIEMEASKQLLFKLGLRYAYNSKFKTPLIPNLSMKLLLKNKYIWRMSIGKGFRAPDLKELYHYFVDINHNIRGNVNLKPEQSININTHLEKLFVNKKFSYKGEISMAFNHLKDKINLVQIFGNDYTYQNIQSLVSMPINFNNQIIYKHLNFNTSIGYVFSRWKEDITINYNQFFGIVQAEYSIPKSKTQINLFYKYNGTSPIFITNEYGEIQLSELSAYHNIDLIINQKVIKNKLDMAFGIKNMLNVKNIDISGATNGIHSSNSSMNLMLGRYYFFKIVYQFSKP